MDRADAITELEKYNVGCPRCLGTGKVYHDPGNTLWGLRNSAGLTAKTVAARMHISPQYLSDLERNRRSWSMLLVWDYLDAVYRGEDYDDGREVLGYMNGVAVYP